MSSSWTPPAPPPAPAAPSVVPVAGSRPAPPPSLVSAGKEKTSCPAVTGPAGSLTSTTTTTTNASGNVVPPSTASGVTGGKHPQPKKTSPPSMMMSSLSKPNISIVAAANGPAADTVVVVKQDTLTTKLASPGIPASAGGPTTTTTGDTMMGGGIVAPKTKFAKAKAKASSNSPTAGLTTTTVTATEQQARPKQPTTIIAGTSLQHRQPPPQQQQQQPKQPTPPLPNKVQPLPPTTREQQQNFAQQIMDQDYDDDDHDDQDDDIVEDQEVDDEDGEIKEQDAMDVQDHTLKQKQTNDNRKMDNTIGNAGNPTPTGNNNNEHKHDEDGEIHDDPQSQHQAVATTLPQQQQQQQPSKGPPKKKKKAQQQQQQTGAAEEQGSTSGSAAAPAATAAAKDNNGAAIYSTRGRSSADSIQHDEPAAPPDHQPHTQPLPVVNVLTKEFAMVIPRETFLSDSITEEERRTRTRYIPQVDGMHALRKPEIKSDLAIMRSAMFPPTSSGVNLASTVAAARHHKAATAKRPTTTTTDLMELEDATTTTVDDDRAAEILRLGSRTVDVRCNGAKFNYLVPATAFVAPPAPPAAADNNNNKSNAAASAAAGNSTTNTTTTKTSLETPRQVESVSAFSPPRPPESIGAKKKHRMLRWERRPADIEVDLTNYRKTVQRTRQEWKHATRECKRMETVEYHLRKHFLRQLQCMDEEYQRLSDELQTAQQDCITAANLMTSRTRSRGAGKVHSVMKDVLAVLRNRGTELETKGLGIVVPPPASSTAPQEQRPGLGGVGAVSVTNWTRSSLQTTPVAPADLASAWIVPGDQVSTPCGDGCVLAFHPVVRLDDIQIPPALLHKPKPTTTTRTNHDPNRMDVDEPYRPSTNKDEDARAKKFGPKKGLKGKKGKFAGLGAHPPPATAAAATTGSGSTQKGKQPSRCFLIEPRLVIQLAFGVGFFNLGSVRSKEDPSTYTDTRLALRWKGLAESAAAMGSIVDLEAAAATTTEGGADGMDLDPPNTTNNTTTRKRCRHFPLGAGMLPTGSARGANLANMTLEELDAEMSLILEGGGGGSLGKKTNPDVPKQVRTTEDRRSEKMRLKAKALQLRNELYRQRRVRLFNERTYLASVDRSYRVEQLVAEMRTDLKTLKLRLDQETRELGVSERQAEAILTAFYNSLDATTTTSQSQQAQAAAAAEQAAASKRQRRDSHSDESHDDDNNNNNMDGDQHNTMHHESSHSQVHA